MARKSRKNVGLIGLGIIGSSVAAALRHAGFPTYVWNRTPKASPNFLSSPAEVADVCDVIQIFVADAQALFDVLDACGELLTSRHTILCHATVGPEAVVEAEKIVAARGAKFLDAPFTGSKIAADNRELVYYIGGDPAVLRAVEPVLQASSKAIVKIGAVGDASLVKIATNMMVAVSTQALIEAQALVRKSGVAPEVLAAALEHHGARSGLTDLKLPRVIRGDFAPHFSLKHMFKDAQIAIHLANNLGIDLPTTTASAGVMYGGLSCGWGDLDFSATAKSYEPPPVEPTPEPVAPQPAAGADSGEKSVSQQLHPVAGQNGGDENQMPAGSAAPNPKKASQKLAESLPATDDKASIDVEAVVMEKSSAAVETAKPNLESNPAPVRNRVKRWFKPRG